MQTKTMPMALRVSDVSGQKLAGVSEVASHATVGELVQGLLLQMNLPDTDATGRPLVYQARLEREGRHLQAAERAVDALQFGDRLTLLPNVDAGGAARS